MCQRKAGTKCSALQGVSWRKRAFLPSSCLAPLLEVFPEHSAHLARHCRDFGDALGDKSCQEPGMLWWRRGFLALMWSGPLCLLPLIWFPRQKWPKTSHSLLFFYNKGASAMFIPGACRFATLFWGWSSRKESVALKLGVPHKCGKDQKTGVLKCLVSLSCLSSEKMPLKKKITRWSARLISYPLSSNSSCE